MFALTGHQLTVNRAAPHGGWMQRKLPVYRTLMSSPATSRGGFSFGGFQPQWLREKMSLNGLAATNTPTLFHPQARRSVCLRGTEIVVLTKVRQAGQ